MPPQSNGGGGATSAAVKRLRLTIGKLLVTLVRAAPCACGHGLTAGVRSEGKVRCGDSRLLWRFMGERGP